MKQKMPFRYGYIPEKFQLYQILNGRLSAIIDFSMPDSVIR